MVKKRKPTYSVELKQTAEGIWRVESLNVSAETSETLEKRLSTAISEIASKQTELNLAVKTEQCNQNSKIDSDISSIGQSKSRIDKMLQLGKVINALQANCDLIDIEDIVKEASKLGFDETYARRLITEMKRQGDLYEPKVGFVKSSRKREW